jgi:hypothetical protein
MRITKNLATGAHQAPEPADTMKTWFDLPRPIVAGMLAIIRA